MQKSAKKISRFSPGRVIIVALLFMMVGTAMELYLLDHYEDTLQLIPILCIGASLITIFILIYRRAKWTIITYKLVLALTALSGVYGTFLHLQANYEFEERGTVDVKGMGPVETWWLTGKAVST